MSDFMRMKKEADEAFLAYLIRTGRYNPPKPKLDMETYDQDTAIQDDDTFQDIAPDDGKGDGK